jgi:hypothetical protein
VNVLGGVRSELSSAEVAEIEKLGIEMRAIWDTAMDDWVFEICGPLECKMESGRDGGKPYWIHPTAEKIGPPPAHEDCRCDLGHALPVIAERIDREGEERRETLRMRKNQTSNN